MGGSPQEATSSPTAVARIENRVLVYMSPAEAS